VIPEISVEQLAAKIKSPDSFVLLDVREPWELAWAHIQDERLTAQPMSDLAREGLDALPARVRDRDAEVFVLCHHGIRSADVAAWLASQGWSRVFSVTGGIDEYARKIDPSVGMY
jgi:rhodanese-related sulfurtransferase